MSDVMLLGVLRMPIEFLQDGLYLLQFIDRAREAADRIEADAERIQLLEARLAAVAAQPELNICEKNDGHPHAFSKPGTVDSCRYCGLSEREWRATALTAIEAQAETYSATYADRRMKDHEIAQTVNKLRDIAIKYHAHGCLRDLIARVVVPLLKDVAAQPEQPSVMEQLQETARDLAEHGLLDTPSDEPVAYMTIEDGEKIPLYADPPSVRDARKKLQARIDAITPLVEAAEQVIARWDTPLWKHQINTSIFIDQLRKALAAVKK